MGLGLLGDQSRGFGKRGFELRQIRADRGVQDLQLKALGSKAPNPKPGLVLARWEAKKKTLNPIPLRLSL